MRVTQMEDDFYSNKSWFKIKWKLFKPSILLENLTDDANAQLYMTKFSSVPLYLSKLRKIEVCINVIRYIYIEIRQTFLTV